MLGPLGGAGGGACRPAGVVGVPSVLAAVPSPLCRSSSRRNVRPMVGSWTRSTLPYVTHCLVPSSSASSTASHSPECGTSTIWTTPAPLSPPTQANMGTRSSSSQVRSVLCLAVEYAIGTPGKVQTIDGQRWQSACIASAASSTARRPRMRPFGTPLLQIRPTPSSPVGSAPSMTSSAAQVGKGFQPSLGR